MGLKGRATGVTQYAFPRSQRWNENKAWEREHENES